MIGCRIVSRVKMSILEFDAYKQTMKLPLLAACWLLSLCQLFFIPSVWLGYHHLCYGLAFGLLLFCVIRHIWRGKNQMHKRTYWWFTIALLVFLGYQQTILQEVLLRAEKIVQLSGQPIESEIKILGFRNQQTSSQVIARADLSAYQLGTMKIQLNWQLEQLPQPGDKWQVRLALRPLSSRLNEGGFNRQRWLLSQMILASANVKQAELRQRAPSWRQRKLAQVFEQTAGLRHQGVILALAFGERAWLDADDWRAFRESGTAHLIAISGLHIGLVAWLMWGVVRLVQFGIKSWGISYRLPHLLALLAAVCYAYLADFQLPTERALWAYAFWLCLAFSRVYLPPWKMVVLIAAWLTWLDPLAILNESFWLSFGAVAALCFYYHFFPLNRWQWRGIPLKQRLPTVGYWLLGLWHLQLGLLLLFTPLQLLIFQAFPTGTLWSNLLLVPLFSFILVPLILLNLLFATDVGWLSIDWLLQHSLRLLAQLPNQYLMLSNQQQAWIILMCFGILLCLLLYRTWRGCEQQKVPTRQTCRRASVLCGLFLLIGLTNIVSKSLNQADWRIEMLDVGQGLAVLLIDGKKATLFDSGQSWQGGSMAQSEILPYLSRQGLELQQLIISHDDNDHAGGVLPLLNAFPSAVLVQSSNKDYHTRQRRFCQKGERWHWRGFQFEAFAPQMITAQAGNADSCVLLVSRDRLRLLLSGDLDAAGERQGGLAASRASRQ